MSIQPVFEKDFERQDIQTASLLIVNTLAIARRFMLSSAAFYS